MWIFKSKKVLLTLTAMVLITIGALVIDDVYRLRWFAAIIGGLVGSYNIGQGIADGYSGGFTSSKNTGQLGNIVADKSQEQHDSA